MNKKLEITLVASNVVLAIALLISLLGKNECCVCGSSEKEELKTAEELKDREAENGPSMAPPSSSDDNSAESSAANVAESGRNKVDAAERTGKGTAVSKDHRIGDVVSISIPVKGSFYTVFNGSAEVKRLAGLFKLPILPKLLSAHVARPLVWKIDLRKDLRKGDHLRVAFRVIPDEEKKKRNDMPDEIEVLAVEYYSQKFGKNINAYLHKPSWSKHKKFFYDDGRTVEPVFEHMPVDDYIQITSVLKDRRPRHDGYDFKMHVGGNIYSTVDGTVTRVNWATRYNGFCVEIKASGSDHTVKYLHLDKALVKRGQSVRPGDLIAKSGNTGRSFAPHLHYQVNRGTRGRVVDPKKFHSIYHRRLKGKSLADFKKKINNLTASTGSAGQV